MTERRPQAETLAIFGSVDAAQPRVTGSVPKSRTKHLLMAGRVRAIFTGATPKVSGGTWAAATIASSPPVSGFHRLKLRQFCCVTRRLALPQWLKDLMRRDCHRSALSSCSRKEASHKHQKLSCVNFARRFSRDLNSRAVICLFRNCLTRQREKCRGLNCASSCAVQSSIFSLSVRTPLACRLQPGRARRQRASTPEACVPLNYEPKKSARNLRA